MRQGQLEAVALLGTGAVLALVSTGALIVLLISLPLSGTEQVLAVATGAGLQACLYLLAQQKDLFSRSMTLVLLLVSVLASTAFMEMAWQRHLVVVQQHHASQQSGSEQAQLLRQSLNNLQQQIDIRIQTAQRDTSGKYTTRGLQQLDSADRLQQRAEQLAQQLAQTKNTESATGAETGSIQALLAGAHRFIRLIVFAVLGVLIDLGALACLYRGKPKQTEKSSTESEPQQQSDPVQYLEKRILAGDFGEQPSQRQAIDEIKNAFDQLTEAGQLVKEGQRFTIREAQ